MHALLRPAGDQMFDTRDAMTRRWIALAAATDDRTKPLTSVGTVIIRGAPRRAPLLLALPAHRRTRGV